MGKKSWVKTEQNNADVIMAELDKLGQSEGDEEVHGGGSDKKSILLSEPVQIIITCLTPPTGAGGPRFFPHQHWKEGQRIRIPTDMGDNFCMFYALVAAKAYHDHEMHSAQKKQASKAIKKSSISSTSTTTNVNTKNDDNFCANSDYLKRLINNRDRLREAGTQLMQSAKIPNNLDSYGIDHLQIVQDLWVSFIFNYP